MVDNIWAVYENLKKLGRFRFLKKTCLFFILTSILFISPTGNKANACPFLCVVAIRAVDSSVWDEAEKGFDAKLDEEFKRVETFLLTELWSESVLPMMMEAAGQFTVVALQQAMAVGMFIDAENQMDAQRLLQEIQAQAQKDYYPSIGMCEFGSSMKSLAETERKGEVTAVVLSQRSQDRQLGNASTAGNYGSDLDKSNRVMQFKKLFCNEKDRLSALSSVCTQLGWDGMGELARSRLDMDIDYFRLMDAPRNLKIDFTNREISVPLDTPPLKNEDEEHVMALASNLFAHTIFPRPPAKLLANKPGLPISNMQKIYIDMRSIVAKRSVAENSFNAIASMKTEGHRVTPFSFGTVSTVPLSSRVYMENILKELGMPAGEILEVLGENPSYYSQMEILTKKIYQNPDFYTNLYDKPANVERKTVALQAIKLMQKFDMLKSFLRNEAATSILLELSVSELQNEVEDQIQAMGVTGN